MTNLKTLWNRAHKRAYRFFVGFVGYSGDKTTRNLFRLFQIALYSLVIVVLLNTMLGHSTWGEYGDFMGGVLNPLLSFVMIMGILMTIILQQKELKEARIEFKRSADALNEQSNSLAIQNFENTFFQMLRLHNDIVNDMFSGDPDTGNKGLSGRDCFEEYYSLFKSHYDRANTQADNYLEIIEVAYKGFFSEKQSDVGHYFRNLYTIVKFVDNSKLPNNKQYMSMLRAQLSSFELSLLFYNCLWSVGSKKFKGFIEEYELLENMNVALLTNPKDQLPLYEKSAYGELEIQPQYKHG